LVGETEVLGENPHQRHFVHKSPDPGSNLGRRSGKPATNRLNYGAASPPVTGIALPFFFFFLLPYLTRSRNNINFLSIEIHVIFGTPLLQHNISFKHLQPSIKFIIH
jgi:hypothetical protein